MAKPFTGELPWPKNKTERNARIAEVIRTIRANPKHHDQRTWHCNTTHCVAGFAQLIGRRASFRRDYGWYKGYAKICGHIFSTPCDARQWMGLGFYQADDLFDGLNDLQDIIRIANGIKQSNYTPDPSI